MASPVQILFGRSNTGSPGRVLLTLDACLQQDPRYKNQVSRYPVESGLDITDHVRMEPDSVRIEGQVTNTPDSATVSTLTNDFTINAYSMLLAISGRERLALLSEYLDEYPGPIIVDLIIKNRVMVDMILEDLNVPCDPQTGDVINFTATFVKVRKATTNLASISYTSDAIGGAGTGDQVGPSSPKGKQQTETPSTDASLAYNAWWNGTITTMEMTKILTGQGTLSTTGTYVPNQIP